ncbi:AbrB/MazE/SpoVT family DNA-binding domain-containing protein [Candidatus Woesearchaeota archaeon]|nr:AbrB/MazE/SpoVT family DNA-binding domain-containing protein [Candidatus Woesearchaeota archaeon]
MKRKVIQIANSTQLISLPRRWALQHGIKKGDEIDVKEDGNKIIISTEKGIELNKVELDITGLDRTSIIHLIRSAYRKGYDTISIHFNKVLTNYFELDKKIKVSSIIHQEVNRLVGGEIVEEKENSCIIKDISKSSIKEFNTALRRMFLLLDLASQDLISGAKSNNLILIETIERKHDTITKFASYCLRLLNKHGSPNSQNITFLYHIIASLDKITDILKYTARDILEYNPRFNDEYNAILGFIRDSIKDYFELFYKFEIGRVINFMENRNKAIKRIDNIKKGSFKEMRLLNKLVGILEILRDLTETRMSMEY